MARQATRRGEKAPLEISEIFNKRCREALMVALSALALFLLLALVSFDANDPGWSHTHSKVEIQNITGAVGALLADAFFTLFGLFGYFFPIMVGLSAWLVLRDEKRVVLFGSHLWALRIVGFVMSLLTGCAILSLHFNSLMNLPLGAGGILGHVVAEMLTRYFNPIGTSLLMVALFFTGITLIFGLSWLTVCDALGRWMLQVAAMLTKLSIQSVRNKAKEFGQETEALEPIFDEPPTKRGPRKEPGFNVPKARAAKVQPELIEVIEAPKRPPLIGLDKQQPLFNKPKLISQAKPAIMHQEGLPPLSLLEEAEVQPNNAYTETELADLSQLVETKLADFGIEVHVVSVNPGPVITRFELQLAPGVKVSKLVGLSKDIARSLSVISVRVVEVIPGKSYVGLEIPNRHREVVRLREILESAAYQGMDAPLCMALGKDISGEPTVVDLSKMPHLLVAGTTGAGKSVGLNAMLVSILYKSTPDQVRMILIDPKMLELSIYEGIPHLLTPVVTDMKDAAAALRWCVAEMERRYKLMAALGVRNLASYNKKIVDAKSRGEKILDPLAAPVPDLPPVELNTLPHIVVLVDEFADMMMVVGKKVEELIARIAQKARAAGIHLILATQRPSVDVITGLIKANVPTRIAFQVSSRIDSRTILDQQGAEALLGHGDMLYLAPGTGIPTRVHGAFVADEEVHRVVKEWKQRGEPHYVESITDAIESEYDGEEEENGETDELYDKALYIVTESRKASISYLQRRLKVGYNRAARLIEEMEKQGVVGSMQSGGVREVLAPPPVKSMSEDVY